MPRSAWYPAAALAPPAMLGASMAVNLDVESWRQLSLPVLRTLLPDSLLYSIWLLVIVAPLAGVALAREKRRALVAAAIFASVSATIHAGLFGFAGDAAAFAAASHVTLATATVALLSIASFCAALWRDPLDAAAVALVAALVATGGVLVVGAPAGDLPRPVLEAVLTASPLVSVAAAAGIDIARTEILYQLSPLAHMHFEYPAWQIASLCYLAIAVAAYAATFVTVRKVEAAPYTKGVPCVSSPAF